MNELERKIKENKRWEIRADFEKLYKFIDKKAETETERLMYLIFISQLEETTLKQTRRVKDDYKKSMQ